MESSGKQAVRQKAKKDLIGAAQNGTLEAAIAQKSMREASDEEDSDGEESRLEARNVMLQACSDGRLLNALGRLDDDRRTDDAGGNSTDTPKSKMDALRAKAKKDLTSGAQSGLLKDSLFNVKMPSKGEASEAHCSDEASDAGTFTALRSIFDNAAEEALLRTDSAASSCAATQDPTEVVGVRVPPSESLSDTLGGPGGWSSKRLDLAAADNMSEPLPAMQEAEGIAEVSLPNIESGALGASEEMQPQRVPFSDVHEETRGPDRAAANDQQEPLVLPPIPGAAPRQGLRRCRAQAQEEEDRYPAAPEGPRQGKGGRH
jgi:hypothetical protein